MARLILVLSPVIEGEVCRLRDQLLLLLVGDAETGGVGAEALAGAGAADPAGSVEWRR